MSSELQEMLAAMREKFLADLPERLSDIERLILSLDGDSEAAAEVYRKIHSLKGSAGTHGAMILTNVCHQLEDFLATVPMAQLAQEQTEIALRYLTLLRTALAWVLEGEQSFPEVEAELQELRQAAFANPLSALVVLPSRSVCKIVLSALEPLPLQPVTVADGMTALQRLLHEPFDLLVTGLKVPSLPGPALIGAVRLAGGVNKDIRTVVVTSGAESTFAEIAQPDLVVAVDVRLMELGPKVASLLQV